MPILYEDLEDTVDNLTDEVNELKYALEQAQSAEAELKQAEFNLEGLEQTVSNPIGVAEYITFTNSHDVAYHLYHTNPEAAQALMNELMYWVVGKN